MLTTLIVIPSFFNISAAERASLTIIPQAITVASEPFCITVAFPISKISPSAVRTGRAARLVRMYIGPNSFANTRVAFAASTESTGQTTFILGNTLINARSSRHCADAPSSPTVTPACEQMTFTLQLL